MWWLKDVRDSDKVGPMILYTGIIVTFLGTCLSIYLALHIQSESVLDRLLLNVGILTAQGGALVTAAMGVLRFQSKNGGNPPEAPKP